MRFTDQYVWNVVFLLFFAALILFAGFMLETRAYRSIYFMTIGDALIISLASFRVIRLVVYDKIFAFFREQFWDARETENGVVLTKPARGPRRTIADLLSCPWCFGVWASAMVTFFYFLTPIALFPTIFLALAGVATFLQLLSNMVGWRAEELKRKAGGE